MPNLSLTPSGAARFRPLPGFALIRVSPAELTSGSLHLPETAAERETQMKAARKGVLVKINTEGKREIIAAYLQDCLCNPPCWPVSAYVKGHHPFVDVDSDELLIGRTVWYLGHGDEMDNIFVVVKLGQIVAVETNATGL